MEKKKVIEQRTKKEGQERRAESIGANRPRVPDTKC